MMNLSYGVSAVETSDATPIQKLAFSTPTGLSLWTVFLSYPDATVQQLREGYLVCIHRLHPRTVGRCRVRDGALQSLEVSAIIEIRVSRLSVKE
jgi:hypothetical protein